MKTADLLRQAVCTAFEVSMDDLLHVNRGRDPVCHARFAAYLIAREDLDWSTPRVGHALRRDHASVLHGARRARELGLSDPLFRENLSDARRRFAAAREALAA